MLRPNLFSCEIKKLRSTFLKSFFFGVFRARLPSARDARAMRQKRARGETHTRGGTKKGTFFSAPPSCIQLFEFASTRLKKGKNWPSFYKLNIFFSSLDFVITLTLPFSYSIEMRAYEAAIIISVWWPVSAIVQCPLQPLRGCCLLCISYEHH